MLGIDHTQVLNPTEARDPALADPAALGVALGRSLAAMKRAAMDEAGARTDYARLANSGAYKIYRACIASVLPSTDPTAFSAREQRLAFWINLYNALILDAVVTYGVEGSVTAGRLGGLNFFRRAAYDVGGMRFCCEDIEHGVLRGNAGNPFIPGPQWEPSDPRRALSITPPDPRVHFALNCASRSCPPVAAYDAARIDAQLELAARNFIAHEVAVDPDRGEVTLSSLFRWVERDFGGRPAMQAFVAARLPDAEEGRWLAQEGLSPRLIYRPYDWRLNLWT